MGSLKHFRTPALIAASIALLPSAALGQNTSVGPAGNSTIVTDTTLSDPVLNETAPARPAREDDHDFPWGLLGLLGLAGLLGRKK